MRHVYVEFVAMYKKKLITYGRWALHNNYLHWFVCVYNKVSLVILCLLGALRIYLCGLCFLLLLFCCSISLKPCYIYVSTATVSSLPDAAKLIVVGIYIYIRVYVLPICFSTAAAIASLHRSMVVRAVWAERSDRVD